MGFGSFGGLLYVLGGLSDFDRSGAVETYTPQRDFWAYDPANNSWAERTHSVPALPARTFHLKSTRGSSGASCRGACLSRRQLT